MNQGIITISRQYGSGGRRIGQLVAQKLQVPCYDKEILELAAQRSGLSAEVLDEHQDATPNSFLYAVATENHMDSLPMEANLTLADRVAFAQFDAIEAAAKGGSCVIIGRCANHILRDHPSVVRLFLYAPTEVRRLNLVEQYGVPKDKATETLRRMDRRRSSYYLHYAGSRWGEIEHYDLCLSTEGLSDEQAADLIVSFARNRWEKEKTNRMI